jgi:hypothetical protein
MKHPIAQTHNGVAVYVNLIQSPAALHISAQPHLLALVKETLQQTNLKVSDIRIEQDMGRDIGYDYVTETGENDGVFYAQLLRENTFTRFVKNGKPNATHYLSMILHRDDDGEYELRDTWIGRLSPPLPGDNQETQDSRTYWDSHALIFDRQPLQLRSVTKVCPY